MDTKYLLVVNYASRGLMAAVTTLRRTDEFANLSLLIVTNRRNYALAPAKDLSVRVIKTDFGKGLQAQLGDYLGAIAGVVCRGDKNIQYLRSIVPFLPPHVPVASSQALQVATDKQLMRAAFEAYDPVITPKYTEVHDPSQTESVEKHVGFPLILKPANLASSLLIRSCFDSKQLAAALPKMFEQIRETYAKEGRQDSPKIIAEEYLEGDFYSIDAYVLEKDIYFCPPVQYIPAPQIGVDDFFLYKRFVPANLKEEDVNKANQVATKAIKAIGLSYSSAHIELVKTSSGWKVIELGPRIGRFRHRMYELGYGINHILNDVYIHLNRQPQIPTKLLKFCAAYSLYPYEEGTFKEISNLSYLQNLPEVVNLKITAKRGDMSKFAKNGGHAAGEFLIASKSKSRFQEMMDYIDKDVRVKVE